MLEAKRCQELRSTPLDIGTGAVSDMCPEVAPQKSPRTQRNTVEVKHFIDNFVEASATSAHCALRLAKHTFDPSKRQLSKRRRFLLTEFGHERDVGIC